jgi:aryl-alcohol dehydrogenase-like predicted oxidoreductase
MNERGVRDQMVISTKLGFDYPGCSGGLTAAEIEHECEKSLRRLQTDRIDLYYAHRDDAATPLEETMQAFDRLIKTGKVRALGASNLKVWRIAEANTVSQTHGWSQYCAIEQRHTYFRPRHGAYFGPQICINDDLKDYSRSRGITLISYSVLLQGPYTGRSPDHALRRNADQRCEAVKALAAEPAGTLNKVIFPWMRQSHPPVLPIIAGSRPEQLLENVAALDITLDKNQLARLDTAGNPDVKQAWLR